MTRPCRSRSAVPRWPSSRAAKPPWHAPSSIAASANAKSNAAKNPYFGRLDVLSSAYLETGVTIEGTTYTGSTEDWYLIAPEAGGLVYGTLNGSDSPEVSIDEPFNTLGRDMRVVWAFGVGAEDWRGLQKNDAS